MRERMEGEQHGCGRKAVKGKKRILGKRHMVRSFPNLPPFLYPFNIPES
jgi:hypothetical protein